MNLHMLFLFAILSVALGSADADLDAVDRQFRVAPCGEFCRFRQCNFNGNRITLPKASFQILGAPQKSQLPYICLPGESVGEILRTGEASVRQGRSFVPISRWRPAGLRRNFPAQFLRAFGTPFLPHSGVGPSGSNANQYSFLHNQCWILPIRRYQKINLANGRVTGRVDVNGRNQCVAFRSTAPAIQVQLSWDTQDDFDLEIIEPDGDKLNFGNKRTEHGRFNGDNNVGFCSTKLLFGREDAVYFPSPNIEKGRYRVIVRHFTKCATRPTNWTVRVVVNGRVVLTRTRFSGVGENAVVGTLAFRF